MTSNQTPTRLYEIEISYPTRQHTVTVEAPVAPFGMIPNSVTEYARMIARTGADRSTYWNIRVGTLDPVRIDDDGAIRSARVEWVWQGH